MSKIIADVNMAYYDSPGKQGNILWNKVRIRKSLDEICHTVELTIPQAQRAKIHKHDKLIMRFESPYITDNKGTHPVTTVLVDDIADTTEENARSALITGRSPARDIIDSTWSGTLNGFNLSELLGTDVKKTPERIATRFGIFAQHMPTNKQCSEKIQFFNWESESPWQKLLGHADCQGYILTSNQAGNLYVWQPGWGVQMSGFFLAEGVNIKRIQVTESGGEQFHEYVVCGAAGEARAIDTECKGKRILTINLTDEYSKTALERRAKTEMKRRKENKLVVTVSGWGLTDDQIRRLGNTSQKELTWEPNFLIPVKIPSYKINDTLLISEVEYTADNSVCETDITLIKQDAFR